MNNKSIYFNKKHYNIFVICQDFRQRVEHMKRLVKQESESDKKKEE